MKKFFGVLTIIVVVMAMFALVGCGGEGDNSSPGNGDNGGDEAGISGTYTCTMPGEWTYTVTFSGGASGTVTITWTFSWLPTPSAGSGSYTVSGNEITCNITNISTLSGIDSGELELGTYTFTITGANTIEDQWGDTYTKN